MPSNCTCSVIVVASQADSRVSCCCVFFNGDMSAQQSQKEGSKHVLQLPCLGSPFKLGMLYDCRTNKLIPGMTLWGSETLSKTSSLTKHETSKFYTTTEDTFTQKALQLEASSAGLKLGLLSGLVQAEGAAEFLHDRMTSKNRARVILSYKSTTTFEQLTMDQLGKIEFTEVFDKDMATHVVTGVIYGSDAFFVFEQIVSKDKDLKKVQENIEEKIQSLLALSMSMKAGEGEASLLTNNEGEATCSLLTNNEADENKLTCRFYGDVVLPSHPTTFQEAVKVYQELPKLMEGKSVAKKVWMHPLADLDERAPSYVCEVSTMLFQKIQELLEFMHEVEVQTNDLIKSNAALAFGGIKKEMISLKKLIDTYIVSVKTNVATLLPQIQAGEATEAKLEEIIKQNSQSPLSQKSISSLIDEKEKEIRKLEEFLNFLEKQENVEFAFKDGDLDSILNADGVCGMVCFDFNIHWGNNPHFKKMEDYLQDGKVTQKKQPHDDTPNPWYTGQTLETIQKQIRLFAGHVEANYGRQGGIKYVVTNGQSKLAKASGEVAVISLCQDSSITRFDPLGCPGKPRAEKVDSDNVQLVWESSKQGSADITGFTVYYSYTPGKWYKTIVFQHNRNDFQTGKALVSKLIPKTTYCFKVRTENNKGRSPCSFESDSIETKPPLTLKEKVRPHCKKIQEGPPTMYELPTNLTFQSESIKKKDVAFYTCSSAVTVQQKVLMLVGATGAGKTTLINGIANYMMGVEWKDDFRFKLITEKQSSDQTKSQTKVITAYTFHKEQGFPLPYSLTVIDTPGFGDTGGLERDKKITAQIKEFFSSENGIDQLHAIGFVVQSSLPRLTSTQSYIFDAILSMFGKDIAENIFLMTTFADGEEPQVLDAVRKANVPFERYFAFNNGALFSSKSRNKVFNMAFWEMGVESYDNFLDALCTVEARSLQLTKEVLTERQHLEVCLEGLQPQIQAGLAEKSKLEKTRLELKQHETMMRANEDFQVKVTVVKQKEIPLEGNLYTTTCTKCNYTCHLHCTISDDSKKHKCASMTWFTLKKNTTCTVCPGKCSWDVHKNTPYRYEFYEEEVIQTLNELFKEFKVAESSRNETAALIENINERISEIDDVIEQMLQQARYSLNRLQEIALKPNPMTQAEYINLLIESEKRECKLGWEDRVKCYEDAKKKALLITKVQKGDVASFYAGAPRPIDPQGKSWLNMKAHGALHWIGKQVDRMV